MSSTHIVIANELGQVNVAGPNANGQLSIGTTTQTNTFTLAKTDATTNLTSIIQAVDGSAHSLFLRSTGLVYAAGLNANGQLGLGTTVDASFAALVKQSAAVDLSNVVSVAAGGFHSAFLLSSGSALACGLNTSGQLGDGTTTQRTNPTLMNTALSTPITQAASISTGDFHSLVSRTDGTAFSAGLNTNGQLGIGNTTSQSYLQQVKTAVAANLTGVSQVAAGGSHSLALTTANTVYAWGANAQGQLSIGTTDDAQYATLCLSAAATTLGNVVQVAAGAAHSLFLTTTGTVFACGSNSAGQLADGTLVNRTYPVQVLVAANQPLTQIASIHATANQSYFLARDGTVYAAGFNGTGAFGNGTTTNSSFAIQVMQPTASYMKSVGFSADYIRRKGFTIANLQTAGFTTVDIFMAGYTKTELAAAGYTIAQFRTLGMTYSQLLRVGYTDSELVAAGYTSFTIVPSVLDGNIPPPLQIAGNILWLDSTDPATITLSGSNVTQWRDKSTNAKHMTIKSGSGPTQSTINSKNILNFSNLSDMQNTSFALGTSYTIFAVGYSTYIGAFYPRMIGGIDSLSEYRLLLGSRGGNFATFVGTASIWNDTNANTPSQSVSTLKVLGVTNNNTSNGLIPYVNGTAQNAKNGVTSQFTGLSVGGGYPQLEWGGYIGEVIIYNSVLSSTDRINIENYLKAKWSIA
jgi:alpha-tubulin suppressor-like RCC1 family protein